MRDYNKEKKIPTQIRARISQKEIMDSTVNKLKKLGYSKKKLQQIIMTYLETLRFALGTTYPVVLHGIGWLQVKTTAPNATVQAARKYKGYEKKFGMSVHIYLNPNGRANIRKAIYNYCDILDDGSVKSKAERKSMKKGKND
jgi:nucleoid DNA-binding protein